MADRKITTGYVVEPRTVQGDEAFAVMREYLYRGRGSQLVAIYNTKDVADSVASLLNLNKDKEF
ncbi:hypothetical protein GCM10010331_44270 [Streptomyces xanthochromogenes]|uniref:hypothetical protein n=1 Tax=Streptomyces xanthochromogenes TaxID=67384 RepID=UPI0016784EE7|nr:hypothetical protein [Streptomyces xanthochromogenes]GHB51873.1 hypothetical protein GCM10010331_44270 [Streptomyces xanthochromogenes]